MSENDPLVEADTPSPLAFNPPQAPCEERLRACEVELMLAQSNKQQVDNYKALMGQALKDVKRAEDRAKALENEVRALRTVQARDKSAMEEFHSLTETLDFKVETKRLKYIVLNNDICYLRFDRNGDIVKAYSPEEFEAALAREHEAINKT